MGKTQARSSRKKTFFILGLVFIAGAIAAGFFNVGLSKTNEMEFCTSCHTMQTPLNEYKESAHFKNASGIQATCSDCHVPKVFGPKIVAKIVASKDVWHEMLGTISTPEKYEQHRWDMANRVWEKMIATDSRECRTCHEYDHMDLSEQDRSASKRHGRAQDQGKTCIECHKGVAHEEPDEPEEGEEHE